MQNKVYRGSTSVVDPKIFADPTFHRVFDPDPTVLDLVFVAGLWIRIDLIRIRIQAKTELSKTISFSNFFEIKI
jgi:hypothetical protein